MHDLATKIGSVIRQRRELLGLLQPQLAELSGVSLRTLQLVEQGTANPSLSTLVKIIDTVGLTLQLSLKDPHKRQNMSHGEQ